MLLKEQLPFETHQTRDQQNTSLHKRQHDDISHWWRNVYVKVTAGFSIAMDCVTCSDSGRRWEGGGVAEACKAEKRDEGEGAVVFIGKARPSTLLLFLLFV